MSEHAAKDLRKLPLPPGRSRTSALAGSLRVPLNRNGFALVLNTGVTALLGVVYWLLAARAYSPHTLGVNTAAISAMMFLAGVAQLNLMSALVRFVPILRGARGRFIAVCYAVAGVAAVVCSAIFLLGISRWAPALGVLASTPAMVVWFIAATVVWCVFNLQDSAMTGLDAAVLVPAENAVYGVAKIVLLVALAAASPRFGIFASWTGGLVISIVPVNLAVFTILLRRRVPVVDEAVEVPTPPEIVRFVAPDYLAALLWLTATTLMPVIVVAIAGATANAYFSLAWMLIAPLGAISASMGIALVATAAGEPRRLPEYARRVIRRTVRLTVPAALTVAIAAPWIVRLFGPEYGAHAALTLSLLALSTIPNTVTALYTSIYRVQRRMRNVVRLQAGLCLSVLVLGPLLLTVMGPAGVGLAWLVCQSTVAIILLSIDPIALPSGRRPADVARDLTALAACRIPAARRLDPARITPLARCLPPGLALTSIQAVTDVIVGRADAVDGSRTVYVKLARTERGDESLERARRGLVNLRADARLDDWTVPRPQILTHDRLDGRRFMIETGLAGVTMAQLLARGAAWQPLAAQASAAIDELHTRTSELVIVQPPVLERWIEDQVRAIETLVSPSSGRVRALRDLGQSLADALADRRVEAAFTHGDFVPGNVLFDADGRAVTGIIDWELASVPDLPALDRAMMLLAVLTQIEQRELGSVVAEVAAGRSLTAEWDSALHRAARVGAQQPLDTRALVLLCWLRHAAAHALYRGPSVRRLVWRRRNVDPVLDAWRPT